MQVEIIYLVVGLILGGIISWIISTQRIKSKTISNVEFQSLLSDNNSLKTEIGIEKEKVNSLTSMHEKLQENLKNLSNGNTANIGLLASKTTECKNLLSQLEEVKNDNGEQKRKIDAFGHSAIG